MCLRPEVSATNPLTDKYFSWICLEDRHRNLQSRNVTKLEHFLLKVMQRMSIPCRQIHMKGNSPCGRLRCTRLLKNGSQTVNESKRQLKTRQSHRTMKLKHWKAETKIWSRSSLMLTKDSPLQLTKWWRWILQYAAPELPRPATYPSCFYCNSLMMMTQSIPLWYLRIVNSEPTKIVVHEKWDQVAWLASASMAIDQRTMPHSSGLYSLERESLLVSNKSADERWSCGWICFAPSLVQGDSLTDLNRWI